MDFSEEEFLACCGSVRFAQEMVNASSSFSCLSEAIDVATHIWFNIVDVHGFLQAFSAHPSIGNSPSLSSSSNPTSVQWSKGEQFTALSTATSSSFQELSEWNTRYKDKFGFVFLICASLKSTDEILAELKRRYTNRPLVELEIAAHEQMKITELRLGKLFLSKGVSAAKNQYLGASAKKAEEDRVSIIGGHITGSPELLVEKKKQSLNRTRPPITTHVLDVSRGSPASGIEVRLDAWKGPNPRPVFGDSDPSCWALIGSSSTDKDGRSGHLMNLVEAVDPGTYRMSFNTSKYFPEGFFPFVSLVFEIKESQKLQHFHVPLLLSPFSFTTYRGS